MDKPAANENSQTATMSALEKLLVNTKQNSTDQKLLEIDTNLRLGKLKSIHPILPKSEEKCTIHYQGKQFELPMLKGNDGLQFLDIQTLYGKTGIFCYDPGYAYTGSCMSSITMAREDGEVFYRGYSLTELVEKSNYVEVCFILLYGDKPTKQELVVFEDRIKSEMLVHQKIHDMYKGFHPEANPMA